ncbi:hypothetical protein [Polaribacter sp.]|uniref:hypothetical protein n=1 Tax=Polaribacter sp. TaxID=1920175 RepID=UPI003F6B9D22
MKFRFFILIAIVAFSFQSKAQNENQKWSFGVSIAGAKYSLEAGKVVGGQLAYQSPRLNISRYIFKGFTLDAAFATAIGDNQKYTTFDGAIRYDFGTSENNVVPYLVVGGSIISALRPTSTTNFGGGTTFWFSPKFGLNMQLLYKLSPTNYESQRSHLYASFGLVYSLGNRSLNPRLWDN